MHPNPYYYEGESQNFNNEIKPSPVGKIKYHPYPGVLNSQVRKRASPLTKICPLYSLFSNHRWDPCQNIVPTLHSFSYHTSLIY